MNFTIYLCHCELTLAAPLLSSWLDDSARENLVHTGYVHSKKAYLTFINSDFLHFLLFENVVYVTFSLY